MHQSRPRNKATKYIDICFALLCLAQAITLLSLQFWLSDLLSEFRMQYIMLFGGILFIYFLSRRWLFVAIASLGLLYNAQFLMPLYLSDTDSCEDCKSESLTVVQFNLYFKNPSVDDFVSWCAQRPDIDLVVLSEAQTNYAALEAMKQHFPFYAGPQENYPSGLAIFSRLPLSQVAWTEPPEDAPQTRHRVNVSLVTPMHEIPVQFHAVHLIYSVFPELRLQRNYALLSLAEEIAQDGDSQTVLVGDLNTTSGHPLLRAASEISGLQDAQLGKGYMASWHIGQWRSWLNGLMLDHMLVSPTIHVESREVVDDDFGSDHLPVITTLSFQTSKGLAQ